MVPSKQAAPGAARHGVAPESVQRGTDPVLVVATTDMYAMLRQGRRVALMEHGIGQSYAGTVRSARHPSYAGGAHRLASMFLHPNDHAAGRDAAAYPEARVEVVGAPILDTLPDNEPRDPIIAFAFHADMTVCDETRSAFAWVKPHLESVAARWPTLGHGHPRWLAVNAAWYKRAHIPVEPDLRTVIRRAAVLVADNTSAMYAFAAMGGSVAVLNPPHYRRAIEHGLRFWPAAGVGVPVDRIEDLIPGIERALERDPADLARRDAAVDIVYARRSGSAAAAAQSLAEWAA